MSDSTSSKKYQTSFSAWKIEGQDTKDFFHRMTSLNMKQNFEDFKGFCFLGPKGHVKSIGWIRPEAENTWTLVSDDRELVEKLDQFIFAEDVEFEKIDKAVVARGASLGTSQFTFDDEFEASEQEFDGARFQEGFPLVRDGIEAYNPYELMLHDFVSEQKGCYPGQEVLEIIVSRGIKPRQHLIKIKNPSGELGEIFDSNTKVVGKCLNASFEGIAIGLVKSKIVEEKQHLQDQDGNQLEWDFVSHDPYFS